MIVRGACLTLMLGLALPLAASDKLREQDYAAELQREPLTGKIVRLQADGGDFLSLLLEAERNDNSDAAIIVHDRGQFPDQKPVVSALRITLPQHRWTTLALQMPLREQSAPEADYYALFDQAKSRIQAAADYLQQNGAKHIVVIGYGLGALMAAYTLNDSPGHIEALAAISLGVPDTTVEQVQTLNFVKNIALPFLDIYAEFDLPDVVDSARQRRMAGKDNPVYWQVKINGETHVYQYDYERLVKRIYSWLSSTFQPE